MRIAGPESQKVMQERGGSPLEVVRSGNFVPARPGEPAKVHGVKKGPAVVAASAAHLAASNAQVEVHPRQARVLGLLQELPLRLAERASPRRRRPVAEVTGCVERGANAVAVLRRMVTTVVMAPCATQQHQE